MRLLSRFQRPNRPFHVGVLPESMPDYNTDSRPQPGASMKHSLALTSTLAVSALVLTSCASGGGNDRTGDAQASRPDTSSECTADKVGGKITVGEHFMLPSFAPGQGHFGVRGAAQSAAIYDRLMRWDPDTEEFVPQLADTLEANEDNTVWTLGLREDVTFSNGDPLTADDVAFTIGLHQDPETQSGAMTDALNVKNVEVVDPQTVKFTLTGPWASFPALLSNSAGEVISQKAYEAVSPDEWATNPIGAGAFVMDQYIPNQQLVLKPNPNYYDGPVCPTLEFIQVPGSQGTLEAFQNGELQVSHLRGSEFVAAAQEAGEPGFHEVISAGRAVFMNNGAAGYDGILTDQRAREAVALALDRELIDQRLTGGVGQPTSALLAESSRFYDGQEGPTYDVAHATELVTKLKEDKGWDGSIEFLVASGPENIEEGIIIKALLDAVGFNVNIENVPSTAGRQFTGDYEMVMSGLAVSEADPASTFASVMTPDGSINLTGVDNDELTEAITTVQAATETDAQKEAYLKLQEVYNRVLPITVIANAEEYVTVHESVKGVSPTIASTMLFDNAYIEK